MGNNFAEELLTELEDNKIKEKKEITETEEKDDNEDKEAGEAEKSENEAKAAAAKNIVWLDEITKKDVPIGGGKGANLAEMYNLKLPVPQAFIVTATSFKRFFEETKLKDEVLSAIKKIDVENTALLEKKAKEIQAMIIKEGMPKALAEEIKEAYENLNIDKQILKTANKSVLNILKTSREPAFVAVRSSATTEDLETASFAGQQETFLNIKGSVQLIEAIKKCWASLFTARAIYYRERKGFSHAESFIAVIVQKMVNADKAGVTFTINPATNNKEEIVTEACFGLGEGVVSGATAPDYYAVDKNTMKILNKKIAHKTIYFTRSAAGNTVKSYLPMEKVNAQILEPYELIRLSNYAKQLESHYNIPQDIEWAIEFGKIYILQTRPVTTHKKEIKAISVSGLPILDGLPASPGVAFGIVKIIRSLEDLPKIKSGDVLVTKMTNPDMVVTMQKSAAIVTDEGGATCIGGNAKILTNEGFVKLKDMDNLLKNKTLLTLSLDAKTKKICWRKILKVMKRKAKTLTVYPYLQHYDNKKQNGIKITPDHKILTLKGTGLEIESLQDIIEKNKKIFSIDKIPSLFKDNQKLSKELMYLSGAIFSDGYIEKRKSGKPMRVKFCQKICPEKNDFICAVKDQFRNIFEAELKNYVKEGTAITGSKSFGALRAASFESSRSLPAQTFNSIKKNITSIVSNAPEEELKEFMAGFVDGDGHFNKGKKWLEIYLDRKDVELLEAIYISALRLGIPTRISRKKHVNCLILNSNINQILEKCKRVKGLSKRLEDPKIFSAKQLFEGVQIKDWRGNLWNYVKKDLFVGINWLANYLNKRKERKNYSDLLSKLQTLSKSDLSMKRLISFGKTEKIDVYNLTINAESELDHNYVIFTNDYTPIVVGNCHAAIVSREVGLPCIVGTMKATKVLNDGQLITVDGSNGKVYSGKAKIKEEKAVSAKELELPAEIKEKEKEEEVILKEAEAFEAEKQAKEISTITKVYMNLSQPDQIERYKNLPFEGIGLLRLEFMIASQIRKHPLLLIEKGSEQEYINSLAEGISTVATAIFPKPIVVRFSDFKSNEYRGLEGGEKYESEEANPMLGFRGASRYISEEFENAFRLECKAILKARQQSKNIWVMLPFVRTTDEVEKCLEILHSEGLERSENFKIWLMAEVPSFALISEEFAKLAIDGTSIGSNDLTQLVLGVDRDSALLGKMGYFDERNKAVLVALHNIIKGFKKHNKTVSICGQAPSVYPEIVEFLVKQGIDSISVNPDAVVSVKKLVEETEKKLLLDAARQRQEETR